MRSYWVDHDHLDVPLPAYGEGGLVGDGMVTVAEDDPLFAQWRPFAVNARPDPAETDQPT